MSLTFPKSSIDDAGVTWASSSFRYDVTLVARGTTPPNTNKSSRRLVGGGVACAVLALRLSKVSPTDGDGPS
jgi:hypothetical protein